MRLTNKMIKTILACDIELFNFFRCVVTLSLTEFFTQFAVSQVALPRLSEENFVLNILIDKEVFQLTISKSKWGSQQFVSSDL